METIDSPDGRYRVQAVPWEAFNSHWVYPPELVDLRRGTTLLALPRHWSMDRAVWTGPVAVRLQLRQYPGAHEPPVVDVVVDCDAGMAVVGAGAPGPLAEVAARLEAAIHPRGAR